MISDTKCARQINCLEMRQDFEEWLNGMLGLSLHRAKWGMKR